MICKKILVVFIMTLSSYLNCQKLAYKVSDTIFSLELSGSMDNIKSFKSINKIKPRTVIFKNIPNNEFESLDEYGRKYLLVDSIVLFKTHFLDTIMSLKDIFSSLDINDKKLFHLTFCYQVLSTDKRISNKLSPKLNCKKVGKFLNQFMDHNSSIILNSITYYDNDDNQFIIDIGNIIFFYK